MNSIPLIPLEMILISESGIFPIPPPKLQIQRAETFLIRYCFKNNWQGKGNMTSF